MSPCVPECHVSWRKPGRHCWRCPKHTTKRYQCHRCGKNGHWVDECDLERPNADGVAAAEAVRKKKRKVVVKREHPEVDATEESLDFRCPASKVPGVRALLNRLGIPEMHAWQSDVLGSFDLWTGRNLVFTAPTSAGKSLVSDVLMLNALHRKGGNSIAFVVLPFVAMCEERYKTLRRTCASFGVDVVRMWSGYGKLASKYAKPTALVCTPERASECVTQLHCADKTLECVCFASVDELHQVQDKQRGPTVEVLLTKLRSRPGIQIVGMSATLRGIEVLADWLDARLYRTEFRPIPIETRFAVNGKLYDSRNSNVCFGEYDSVADFCRDREQRVIVFCGSRANAELTCSRLREELAAPEMVDYHHAGLDKTQKTAVLNKFRERKLRVLCATSTVAFGVNLPVDLVIVHGLEMGFDAPDAGLKLHQMIGRAGRTGHAESGKAVIFLRSMDEFEKAAHLARGSAGALASALTLNDRAWRRFALEASVMGLVRSRDDVIAFAESTLYAKLNPDETRDGCEKALAALEFCIAAGLVHETTFAPTSLGVAACRATIDLGDIETTLDAFRKVTEEGLIMTTPLQLLYTLVQPEPRPDVTEVRCVWSSLNETQSRVAERLGLRDRGPIAYRQLSEQKAYLRFVHALALERIADEVHVADVAREFNVPRLDIMRLQESVSRHARNVATLCETDPSVRQISVLLERLADRIARGVREELIPLTSVPEIDAVWARYFFNAGFKTPSDIAAWGEPDKIVQRVQDKNGSMVTPSVLRYRVEIAVRACKT